MIWSFLKVGAIKLRRRPSRKIVPTKFEPSEIIYPEKRPRLDEQLEEEKGVTLNKIVWRFSHNIDFEDVDDYVNISATATRQEITSLSSLYLDNKHWLSLGVWSHLKDSGSKGFNIRFGIGPITGGYPTNYWVAPWEDIDSVDVSKKRTLVIRGDRILSLLGSISDFEVWLDFEQTSGANDYCQYGGLFAWWSDKVIQSSDIFENISKEEALTL